MTAATPAQALGTGSGVKLKDFGESAIQDASRIKDGQSAVENNTAAYGVLSPEAAAEYNSVQNAYYAPLEQQYGITGDQLTQLFQQNVIPTSVQQQLESGANDLYNATVNPDQWYDKLFSQLALAGTVGVATAGIGSALAAPAAAALGSTVGGIAAGAGAGIAGGALSAALQGQNIGKGALVGGISGGVGAAASPLIQQLVSQGMPVSVAQAVVKGGAGAVGGAAGAGINGGNLLQGAEGGALSGAEGSVQNSIFSGASTIFNSGSAASPTTNPGLTNPAAPSELQAPPGISLAGNPSMSSDPFSFLSQTNDDGPDNYVESQNSGVPTDFGFDPSSLGNIDTSSLLSELQGNDTYNPAGIPSSGGGGIGLSASLGGGSSGSGNSSLLSQLASALGGGSGGNTALLSQLLGLGATTAGGALNSDAAKSAASAYGGQTAFNPYSTSTNLGSTSFNGTSATAQLSPQQQMLSQMLGGLAGSSGSALAAGPQATTTADFNNLQSGSLQAQQRLLGNTQDNEFANGVLGSTAGSYQTQGALNSIGQQTNQNYQTASNLASTQQQQQLAQLTASLTGNQNINSQQLQQLQAGLTGGAQASNANATAYAPSLYANSNSTFGNALTGLGNSFVNPTTGTG